MGEDVPGTARTFADFGVEPDLCEALTEEGITTPFPIQELTLPMALGGADVIGQARTGTGKTLAFGLPALQRLDGTRREVQVLVVVPTRELCLQVTDDLATASSRRQVRVSAVYGGRPLEPQIQALQEGVHVVVGTPGRLLDLHRRGALHLSAVATLVLDEADEMLDLGFLPDVEQLIEACPTRRQTLLFSATMPPPVVALARRYMDKPTFLRAEDEPSQLSPDTEHHFFSCHRLDKPAVLARILQAPTLELCVVFTRTKRMADQLAGELRDRDVDAVAIHSDLRQEAREKALRRFRQGKVRVLVATEVAARGLDIADVTHVVNYDCPDDEKMYLHRIGRTGRAGAAGVAITLAVWNELARLEIIKKALDLGDEPTHEVFSTSDLLDELFDLPARAPVTRPRGGKPAATEPEDGGRGGDDGGGGPETGRGQRGSRRGRRGGRRRSKARREPEAGAAETSAPQQPTAETGRADAVDERASEPDDAARTTSGDGDGERRRVRTRTRTRRGASASGRAAARVAGDGSSTASAAQGEGQAGGGTAGTGGDGERAVREAGAGSAQRDGASSKGRSKRSGKGRRAKGRRGGRQSGRQTARRDRPTSSVPTDQARGEGQPRIRRPLQVQHLP